MSPEDNSRKPFVFVLKQNFSPQLAARRLVYAKNPEGLAVRLKPIFFIGIGGSRLITGPYKLIGGVKYCPDSAPINMARMTEADPVYGIWKELRISCPYQVRFRPLVPVEYGILWDDKFCKEFGLQIDNWRSLIKVSLTEDQITILAERLTQLNSKAK